MYLRAQERVYLRDNHHEKAIRVEKVRVRRVRMTLRTRILREKVRSKVVQAQRRRRTGTTTTLSTLLMKSMDMVTTHQTNKNKIRSLKQKQRKKILMTTSGVEKTSKRNQNRTRIMSRWSRPLYLC